MYSAVLTRCSVQCSVVQCMREWPLEETDPTLGLQMHGLAGLHSARAISRQRELRAKKRAMRDRRLSSRTDSIDSIEPHHMRASLKTLPEAQLGASIGMLHIGICFLALGLFFIGSGLLPDDFISWRSVGWWNELVATGLFVSALGVFLIVLNRVMSKKEEEELNDYVQRQLTRSRSGHRLERDVETGCLTTKNHRRVMEKKREDQQRGLESPKVHSPISKHAPDNAIQNGEIILEQILEEDVFERGDGEDRYRVEYEVVNRETISNTTTASLSPGTPSETRELIANGRHHHHSSRPY